MIPAPHAGAFTYPRLAAHFRPSDTLTSKGARHAEVHDPLPRRCPFRLHLRGGADDLEEAVDLPYDGGPFIKWTEQGVVEFDTRHIVALDANGDEIERYSRGKG